MMAGSKTSVGVIGQDVALTATVEATTARPPTSCARQDFGSESRFAPRGSLFSPQVSLVWIIGLLGLWACILPWFAHGWLWFGLIATAVALLACYDALAVWFSGEECAPVLLRPEKGLRGREGQTIQIPFALTGSGRELAAQRHPRRHHAGDTRERNRIPGEERPSAAEA